MERIELNKELNEWVNIVWLTAIIIVIAAAATSALIFAFANGNYSKWRYDHPKSNSIIKITILLIRRRIFFRWSTARERDRANERKGNEERKNAHTKWETLETQLNLHCSLHSMRTFVNLFTFWKSHMLRIFVAIARCVCVCGCGRSCSHWARGEQKWDEEIERRSDGSKKKKKYNNNLINELEDDDDDAYGEIVRRNNILWNVGE